MKRTEIRCLDKDIRNTNFLEVSLGYSDEEAQKEANRCLNCKNPRCVKGCPVGVRIPEFIEKIRNNDLKGAYEIISDANSLPAICGRVCPQEKQCESMCIKGFKGGAIAIGALERYVADYARKNNYIDTSKVESNGKRIAIIGSGPSGLTCASILARKGYDVTIYEALHKAGGVLVYGIPEFRLPNEIIDNEIATLKDLGVKFILNAIVGVSITLDELKSEYDAIYLATGAGLPKFMGIENEDANGVFSANEILTRINLMGAYKENSKTPIMDGEKVIVVGGGNVAMDAARSMKRLGRDVTVVYRRSMDEIPARRAEVHHAIEEGVQFKFLTNPVKIMVDNDNFVKGILVVDMELISGEERKNVKAIDGSEHVIDADIVIMALGTTPNKLAINNSDIKTNDGLIVVDGVKTSINNVYAGGDAVTGAATVILAMEAGKKAAEQIIDNINNL